MAKKDYKAMAAGIIKQAGGADNIVSATHCMTRLRLVLRDRSKFDTDAVKQVPGVLNVIIQNGEYQVVVGQDVPDLYEEVVRSTASRPAAACRTMRPQPRIWHRITATSATRSSPSSAARSAR